MVQIIGEAGCTGLTQINARRRSSDYWVVRAASEFMMAEIARRNRLLPWYIGIVVIFAAAAYVGYQMFATACPASPVVELIVLLVMPAVYLVLMYLTLVSQE
jgi:hypothetical protein